MDIVIAFVCRNASGLFFILYEQVSLCQSISNPSQSAEFLPLFFQHNPKSHINLFFVEGKQTYKEEYRNL